MSIAVLKEVLQEAKKNWAELLIEEKNFGVRNLGLLQEKYRWRAHLG